MLEKKPFTLMSIVPKIVKTPIKNEKDLHSSLGKFSQILLFTYEIQNFNQPFVFLAID
jgi:hypothetical protein